MQNRYFEFSDTSARYVAWEEVPSECPHCGRSMRPPYLLDKAFCSAQGSEYRNAELVELFQCTYSDCQKYFIQVFKIVSRETRGYETKPIHYDYSHNFVKASIPDRVETVSPSFVQIYSQSVQAENSGLDEIAGIGYRKALEFLIKDYAIKAFPDREQAIKNAYLGKVIADELDEFPRLKNLAKAANWIGTDQTHYIQKFSGADLQSMKSFITSAALFVAADANADEAQAFTDNNDPKKSQDAVDK